MATSKKPNQGRYAYEGLDRVIHEKARLGILTSLLARVEGISFNDLKDLCSLTDGNLSGHVAILQEAGLVEVSKGTRGNRPLTVVRITTEGRAKFREYLDQLEQVIRDAMPEPAKQANDRKGWSPA
ncbi:MAG: transcriptional regulator [Gemmataceae bacterium]|nr:transcriptional regulator [Gemmataceae bacterium]